MKYYYARSKISEAIFELCTGSGDLKNRLLTANNITSTLTSEHFPAELQQQWEEIYSMLTSRGPTTNYEGKIRIGAIENTINKIRNNTRIEIAKKLYELNSSFQKKY